MPIKPGERENNLTTDANDKDQMLSIIDAGLTQIATDKAAIDNNANAAELAQILKRTLNRQDKIIRAIRALIRNR